MMVGSRAVGILGVSVLLALAGAACGSEAATPDGDGKSGPGPDGTSVEHKPGVTPQMGATDFVSADSSGMGSNGLSRDGAATGAPPPAGAPTQNAGNGAESDDPREVERGDIFRVLPDGRILNLNGYRGLQIIDIRDVNAPRIEGRLAVTGQPVEMYVVGERAIVLLNDWRGYYGSRDDVRVESVQGGLVMMVDISDRARPRLLDQSPVRGSILTSRLTQGGDKAALYVAAQFYDYEEVSGGFGRPVSTGDSRTVVKSFDVTGNAFLARTELDLGGYVQDVQATTDVMMVARHDYTQGQTRSRVALVDISSPDGTMVLGDEVATAGMVQNKFNLDIHDGVLRVVSGSNWNGTTNHLETFAITNLADVQPIDHCTFGDGQQLFATLFVQNKGFFVTYLRQDPFHAFAIDDQGHCEERAEFVVSGWNEFFRAVHDDSRLIGIGHNDENRTNVLAVSLYDISDIDNPSPLLARAEIDLSWAYSEATWDDRAFGVLEDATSVAAADGTEETGVVLLPFNGWNASTGEDASGVQIFTFSDHTLTARGVMQHGGVRRSFVTGADTTANLSEEQLSLFDTADPNAPVELGRVDLAPNYRQVLVYGDHLARVRDAAYYGGYSPSGGRAAPPVQVEIVPRAGDPEAAQVVARVSVPSGAELVQVGDLLVSILSRYDSTVTSDRPVYQTSIEVYDLADPSAPRKRGSLTTSRIDMYYGGWGYRGGVGLPIAADCFDCGRGGYYYGGTNRYVVPGAIVFPKAESHQRSLGLAEQCYEYPNNAPCEVRPDGAGECGSKWYAGGISCTRPLESGKQLCSGDIYVCDTATGTCEPGEPAYGTNRSCNTYEQFRYWNSFAFDVLDLSDPDHPALAPTVELPDDEEGTSLLAAGNTLYVNYQVPLTVNPGERPLVRRYFRALDLSEPGAPALGNGVNVPGDVIAADGGQIYTRDLVWDDDQTETLVARLQLAGGKAELKAQRLFDGRAVSSVELDGAGHVLVSHDPAWSRYGYAPSAEQTHRLSILDAGSLAVAGETDVDSWATFVTAEGGRALFSVSGGVLIVNVEDPAAPFAQAYFPTMGWYADLLLDAGEILYAGGPYGIYRFDADAYNLLAR